MKSYNQQKAWKKIQSFLPLELQLNDGNLPREEWWKWKTHTLHLDCYRNPQAAVKVILFHGVGTNGRQMTTILGAPLARLGYETIAVDMPEYGLTDVGPGPLVTYDDWVQAGSDLIDYELAKDDRPIILYGLSAGGMLTYHVAAKNKRVKGIIGMTFLDQRVQLVRDKTSFNVFKSRIGIPLVSILSNTLLAGIRVPMSLASKMYALVNNPKALLACLADETSAGKWVTMRFLDSYMDYQPVIEPEHFTTCPVLLTQPAEDQWTPEYLSDIFLQRLMKVSVKKVTLEKAGHYPLEQPGLTQMRDEIDAFIKSTCNL